MDECDDVEAESVEEKISVILHSPTKDWFDMGGLEDGESPVAKDQTNSYFYQKW